MKIIIGIDIGGSTTKIVGFKDNELMAPLQVKANDALTSVYGAFGKFLNDNNVSIEQIQKVFITGVGSTFIKNKIYNIPTYRVDEFLCIGKGGQYISSVDDAVIVSMGTGTAFIRANKDNIYHIGGTGVGGGTLLGLSSKMLNLHSFSDIVELAKGGNLRNVDLYIGDISRLKVSDRLHADVTASNFGKMKDTAEKADIALGIINMVFQTVAMLAIFASRPDNVKDIILIGNLTTIEQAKPMFGELSQMFSVNFMIPSNAIYATAIGAALSEGSASCVAI